jgi:head-tail adaptor
MRGATTAMGEFRHLVTVEAPTLAADEFGQPVQSWTALFRAWAKIEPGQGSERFDSDKPRSLTGYTVTLRGTPRAAPPKSTHRVIRSAGLPALQINSVVDADGTGRYWILSCVEEGAT